MAGKRTGKQTHLVSPSPSPTPSCRSDDDQNEEEEEEEVVWVKTVASGLAERFSLQADSDSRASSSTSAYSHAGSASVHTKKNAPKRQPRAAPSAKASADYQDAPAETGRKSKKNNDDSVPEWLGRPTILRRLKICVVCHSSFKAAESGIARWRHISTCLPVRYRPPNPPPDLEGLLIAALEPDRDLTLLAARAHTAHAAKKLMATQLPEVGEYRTSLLKVTTVKDTHRHGDVWADQIDSRVSEIFGESSQSSRRVSRSWSRSQSRPKSPLSQSRSPTRSYSRTISRSLSPEIEHPSTQPMGESDLRSQYARPPRSPSPEIDIRADLLMQAPPAFGLTAAERTQFAREENNRARQAEAARSRDQRAVFAATQSTEWHMKLEDDVGGFYAPSQAAGWNAASPSRPTASLNSQTHTTASQSRFRGGGFRYPASGATPIATPPGLTGGSQPFSSGGDARGQGRRPQGNTAGDGGRGRRARAIAIARALTESVQAQA